MSFLWFWTQTDEVIVNDEHEVVSLNQGALEEMLTISSHAEYQGVITPLTDAIREEILAEVRQLNQQGLRVLGGL